MGTLPPELTELNLLTLNCWGLPYISAHRASRLIAIGRSIASATPTPQIVALQECWTQEDYRCIRRSTRYVLPYGKFYHSGAFGGGLAILSRWPIEESTMYRYPLNGRPTAFFRGDWYVGKGVACAKIRFGRGPLDVIEVFNTHTHSIYEHAPRRDSYMAHRLSQAWELSKLLRGAAARGHLVLALGDLNDVPLSLPHRIVTSHAPVRDVWRVLHPDSSVGAAEDDSERSRRLPIPTAQFNIDENGVTSNSIYNTWRWPRAQKRQLGASRGNRWPDVPADSLDHKGKRLDYIFASSGTLEGGDPGWGWVVHDARVGLLERHPELGCSLSDHFSVEATLVRYRPGAPSSSLAESSSRQAPDLNATEPNVAARPSGVASVAETRGTEIQEDHLTNGVYLQSPTTSEAHLPVPITGPRNPNLHASTSFASQLQSLAQPVPHLPSSTYDEILAHIHTYLARERFQRRWRGIHFCTWVVVAVVCYVGVWFTPNYVSFILMVLSGLGLVAGLVDGLIALLFIGAELNAIKEFEWEIMNAKATASGAGGLMGEVEEREEREKRW